MIGDISETEVKIEKMRTFMQRTLNFDRVEVAHRLDRQGITDLFAQIEGEEITPHKSESDSQSGSLLLFFFYLGYWESPSGSRVFTGRGESVNFDQRTVAFSANPHVYVI